MVTLREGHLCLVVTLNWDNAVQAVYCSGPLKCPWVAVESVNQAEPCSLLSPPTCPVSVLQCLPGTVGCLCPQGLCPWLPGGAAPRTREGYEWDP